MSICIRDIMRADLVGVPAGQSAAAACRTLTARGVPGGPVLDSQGRPLGFVSLGDLVGLGETSVEELMTVPIDTVGADEPVERAADVACSRGRHLLVAVDPAGRAVGVVGVVDILEALRRAPEPDASNPRLSWSPDAPLDLDGIQTAPNGPGFYMLIRSRPGRPHEVVWSEADANVRQRLQALVSVPRSVPPRLARLASEGGLWFKAAAVAGDELHA